MQKIPYIIICGKSELQSKKIAVRKHGLGSMGTLTIRELIKKIKEEHRQTLQSS